MIDCESLETSQENVYDGVSFSKVKSLPRSHCNFTIKRTYHRFIWGYVPKASRLKKNILRKSLWWTSALIKLQSFSTQPSVLSKNETHVRPSSRSAESSNMFKGKPLWWRLFVIKKNFMAPFYRWGSTVYHSVPKSFWYSFNQRRKDERLTWC